MPLFYAVGEVSMKKDYFTEHRKEFLKDLKRLVDIDSSKGVEEADMPYGKGPAAALEEMLKIAEEHGLYTENWNHYLGIVQLEMSDETVARKLDILTHLDVVPGGSGWTKTKPFDMIVEGETVYGRGTADDKGPSLAAIYALCAVKEKNIPLKGTVRLVLGCDEESGSSDLDYYFSKTKPAEMSFSPDSEYPLINAEKGLYMVGLSAAMEGALPTLARITWLDSGEHGNTVPDHAYALVKGLSAATVAEYMKEAAKGSGLALQICDSDRGVEIEVYGKSAHASKPEEGINALTGILMLLAALPLQGDPAFEKLCILRQIFPHGCYYGQGAGLSMEDSVSGKLTASLNVLHFDGRQLECRIDSRVPVYVDKKALQVFEENIRGKGFHIKTEFSEAHYVSEDSGLVQTLLKNYEKVTGKKGFCQSSGGATYVHHIDNGVAFGCAVPGVDNHMHGPDEFAEIDVLLDSGRIFTECIIALCGEEKI